MVPVNEYATKSKISTAAIPYLTVVQIPLPWGSAPPPLPAADCLFVGTMLLVQRAHAGQVSPPPPLPSPLLFFLMFPSPLLRSIPTQGAHAICPLIFCSNFFFFPGINGVDMSWGSLKRFGDSIQFRAPVLLQNESGPGTAPPPTGEGSLPHGGSAGTRPTPPPRRRGGGDPWAGAAPGGQALTCPIPRADGRRSPWAQGVRRGVRGGE